MPTTPPLIAHVHVPKTAGSTINAALAATLGQGRDHVQAIIDDPEAITDVVRSSRWVAGHVPTPRFRELFESLRLERVRFVTALRDPRAHVASHYNWLIEIGQRGKDFLHRHPRPIIDIHHTIRTSNNLDPKVIIKNLDRYSGLFMNCQAKHVVGPKYAGAASQYNQILSDFDAVILSNNVQGGLEDLIGRSLMDFERINQSSYHFDPMVFDDHLVKGYLSENNRYDICLWNTAKELSLNELSCEDK